MYQYFCAAAVLWIVLSGLPVSADTPPAVAAPMATSETTTLTLDAVVNKALHANAELLGLEHGIRALDARAEYLPTLSNPELAADIENLGVGSETTVSLSQRIELGNTRGKRRHTAELDAQLARAELYAKQNEVRGEATRRFVDVLAAQRHVELSERAIKLADDLVAETARLVAAATVPAIEVERSRMALAEAHIRRKQALYRLDASRAALALLWSGTSTEVGFAVGSFDSIADLSPFSSFADRVTASPRIAVWDVEGLRRQSIADTENATALPELTVSGGWRRPAGGGNAGVLGISIPIPVLDRNQGERESANLLVAQVPQNRQAEVTRILELLTRTYGELSAAHAEATDLRADILPRAERVLEGIRQGYRNGGYGYSDVLFAERALVEADARLIESLAQVHRSLAEIEQLIGGSSVSAESAINGVRYEK